MKILKNFSLVELLLFTAIAGILALVSFSVWSNRNEPTETLRTKDWQCLKTEYRAYTYPMLVGKITTVQTSRREECVLWKRREE